MDGINSVEQSIRAPIYHPFHFRRRHGKLIAVRTLERNARDVWGYYLTNLEINYSKL